MEEEIEENTPEENLEERDFDDHDFQIEFYEGVLRKNPNFVEALSALGDLYTAAGFFQKGLEIDERLIQLRPEDPIVLYNLACSYSLLHRMDEALKTIQFAIEFGYHDFEHLEEDEDLANLRNDQRFQDFYNSLKKNRLTEKNPQTNDSMDA